MSTDKHDWPFDGIDRTKWKPRALYPMSFDPCSETRDCGFIRSRNQPKWKAQSYYDPTTGLWFPSEAHCDAAFDALNGLDLE